MKSGDVLHKQYRVTLAPQTHRFYDEVAKALKQPMEKILSDALCKCAEIVMRETDERQDGETEDDAFVLF